MKKFILFFLIVIVLVVAGFYIHQRVAKAPELAADNLSQAPAGGSPTPSSSVTPSIGQKPNGQTLVKGGTSPDYTPPAQAGGGETSGPDIQVYEVDYDGKTFSPASLSVHVGDYVFFKNNSEGDFWPLSLDSDHLSLNAAKVIVHGGEYKFEFKTVGTWNYSDKLNTSASGKIVVAQ